MLAATIQALEVQRMTLSTLKSMNVQMGELGESLKSSRPHRARRWDDARRLPAPRSDRKTPGEQARGCAVDPMRGGARSPTSRELATSAMKDSATDAAKSLRRHDKQSFDPPRRR